MSIQFTKQFILTIDHHPAIFAENNVAFSNSESCYIACSGLEDALLIKPNQMLIREYQQRKKLFHVFLGEQTQHNSRSNLLCVGNLPENCQRSSSLSSCII